MSRIDQLREALGGTHPLAVNKVKPYLEPFVKTFIENASFAVMATADCHGNCDASPKGGKAGFMRVIDEQTLMMPDINGNRLFQSFENFESNPKAGFIFMIPGMEITARVNGRVRVIEVDDPEIADLSPDIHNPDAHAGLVQGIELKVDEAYFHCPRSLQFADLWNIESIAANQTKSLKSMQAR